VEIIVKVNKGTKMVNTYIAYCSIGNKGYTIEGIVGTVQEIVNVIRDRRLSYGNVDIISTSHDGTNVIALITYIIPTT
jgi:hypothetical protein